MKKTILFVGIGLLTTAGVTAAVMNNSNRKKDCRDTEKKECTYKKKMCTRAKTACY